LHTHSEQYHNDDGNNSDKILGYFFRINYDIRSFSYIYANTISTNNNQSDFGTYFKPVLDYIFI